MPTPGTTADTLNTANIVIDTTATTITTNVLWQNSNGDVSMWLVQNGQNAGSTELGQITPSSSGPWTALAVGDFNGDGNEDVLWRNSNGDVGMSRIQNGAYTAWISLGYADPSQWTVAGVGDFNHDGQADILWYNQSNGLTGAWLSNNKSPASSAHWVQFGVATSNQWMVAGVGDFNGDGYADDILWYNQSSGLTGAWLQPASGTSTFPSDGHWVSFGSADPSQWKVAGVGDFDGDGRADVLWQNQSTGLVGEWLSSKATSGGLLSTGWTSMGQADPKTWSVAGVGDFNGDGQADILWYDQSGLTGEWLSNKSAATLATPAGWSPLSQMAPTQWHIINPTDGQAELAARVGTAPVTDGESLTASQLQPVIREAIAGWTNAGLDAAMIQRLSQVQFVISDLPGSYLGETEGNRVYIDISAAGNGWFVDPTAGSDEEFALSGSQQQLVAVDPRAVDRIDLLTVVEHELGHVVGLSDIYAPTDDIMGGVLGAGVRREPVHADVVLASL